MSEFGEFNMVVANSPDVLNLCDFKEISEKIVGNLEKQGINVLFSISNSLANKNRIIEAKPELVLFINKYKNLDQVKEDITCIRKIRKKLPESKLVLFSNESTLFKDNEKKFLETGLDLWIPFFQVKNLPQILVNLHNEEKINFEGIVFKDNSVK